MAVGKFVPFLLLLLLFFLYIYIHSCKGKSLNQFGKCYNVKGCPIGNLFVLNLTGTRQIHLVYIKNIHMK